MTTAAQELIVGAHSAPMAGVHVRTFEDRVNISVIGLIQIPTGSLYLVAELFGLIVVLAASFAAVFMALVWRQLGARPLGFTL